MKILVTGFDPFGGESINPAWEAVKKLPKKIGKTEVHILQIPTVFKKSIDLIVETSKVISPDIILCIGQAGGRFEVSVERVGINIDDARIADNEGNQPIDTSIYSDGENSYFSNLPIKAMVEEMKKIGTPSIISNTAGTFVCNHVLYGVLYNICKYKIAEKGGFIHVPYIPEQVIGKKNTPYMDTERITNSIVAAIKAIEENKIDIIKNGGSEF